MDTSQIIELIGGKRGASALTGADTKAVNEWRHNGIPARFWHRIVARAEDLGHPEVSFGLLEEIAESVRRSRTAHPGEAA